MSNLSLFGQTLSNVTAFTLPTTGGSTATYTEGGVTPTGNINITQAGVTDVTNYATATVPEGEIYIGTPQIGFITESGSFKYTITNYGGIEVGDSYGQEGYIADGTWFSKTEKGNAIPKNTSVTPTESAQTIGGSKVMMQGAVTVNAIPSNYVGSGITQRSSSDLTANNLTVTAPAGYYSSAATKTLSDQNLVAGNIKKDVVIFGTTGTYEGGGGSGMVVADATATPSSASSSISFTNLSGEPTSFVITSNSDLATGASPYKVASVVFDGTNVIGQLITNTSNAQVTYDSSGFSKSYSNGTLTVTATGGNFQANQYNLVYSYGGSSANLGTADVQVGSGATSITFTNLDDEPDYFSCVFKSNFSTSSGYQRVIAVVYDGTSTYGLAMDSGAKAQTSWTYSYSNGSLTITSSGTNSGGYFHQPGYYQLTYGYGGEAPEIETESLSVTQNGTYTAPRGKAYTPVVVNVSGSGSASIGTKTTTNSSASNTSISFTQLSGTPKAFFVRLTTQVARNSSNRYYYVVAVRWDGSSSGGVAGSKFYQYNGTYSNQTSGYSYSYSNNTLTLTSTGSQSASPGSFYNGDYELIYVY